MFGDTILSSKFSPTEQASTLVLHEISFLHFSNKKFVTYFCLHNVLPQCMFCLDKCLRTEIVLPQNAILTKM